MLVKECTKCGVLKSPNQYHLRRGRYMGACKQCHAKYANKYYHEKVKNGQRQRKEPDLVQPGDVGSAP